MVDEMLLTKWIGCIQGPMDTVNRVVGEKLERLRYAGASRITFHDYWMTENMLLRFLIRIRTWNLLIRHYIDKYPFPVCQRG